MWKWVAGYQLAVAGKVYRHFEPPEGLSLAGGEKSPKQTIWQFVNEEMRKCGNGLPVNL